MSFHHTTRLFPGNFLEFSCEKKGLHKVGAERRQPLDFCAFVSGKILILKVAGHLGGARSARFFQGIAILAAEIRKNRSASRTLSVSQPQAGCPVRPRRRNLAGMPPDLAVAGHRPGPH